MIAESLTQLGSDLLDSHKAFRNAVSLKLLPIELHRKAQVELARLAAATSLQDLQELRGNRLEVLKGDRAGQYSIRINDQYRICFRWHSQNAYDVEIIDYHS